MTQVDKPLLWLHGEIKTPPFSLEARIEAGVLLRRLQRGESLGMPHSRPMRSIGTQVHELRINDETTTWRIVYHVATDAIVIWKSSQRNHSRHHKLLSPPATDGCSSTGPLKTETAP